MEWKPIETAPRDGTDILCFWPDVFKNDSWNVERTWFVPDEGIGRWETPTEWESAGDYHAPTHWMPLPPPPQET